MSQLTISTDENAIQALYFALLEAWNRRSSGDFAAFFDEESHVIGFDGSQMQGRTENSNNRSPL